MSATIIADTYYRAFVDDNGIPVIFSFEQQREAGRAHTIQWRMVHAGRTGDTIRHIAHSCALIEEGELIGIDIVDDSATDINQSDAHYFAERQMAALRRSVPIIKLPKQTVISSPSFDLWEWRGFTSRQDLESRFSKLLMDHGVSIGEQVHVASKIGLLLELDKFPGKCHAAWPTRPIDAESSCIPIDGARIKENTLRDEIMIRIDREPEFLVSVDASNGNARVGTEIDMRQDFWTRTFLLTALDNWQSRHDTMEKMLASSERIPAENVHLQRPDGPEWRPGSQSGDRWDQLLGRGTDETTMKYVIQRVEKLHHREWLARSAVASIASPDLASDQLDGIGPR